MKNKTSNRLSIAALALSAIALLVTLFRIEIVLTHDTWIGIMSSLIGAAATLIVGTQIFNSITTRRELESIRSLQKELKNELDNSKLFFQGNHFFSGALVLWKTQQFSAVRAMISAIRYYLCCGNYEQCNIALGNCEKLLQSIQEQIDIVNSFEYDKDLSSIIDIIRRQDTYDLIKVRFEKILVQREELIRLIDEREKNKKAA